MAVTYGFFNSVNGDRKYNAEQMSEYFRGIINEGVYQHLDGGLAVTAGTGLAVNVAAGRAIIQNRWIQNSAAMSLTIAAASETYARKDAVVIRLNWSSRSISIAVKTGTPAASPVAPSMTRNRTTYEMALAYVNVAANATSVTVTDKRSDSTVCGWVTVAQSTSGEVDAMLNDMKTGFDGVVYDSPGAAVRGCDNVLDGKIDDLRSAIIDIGDALVFHESNNKYNPSTKTTDAYLNTSGAVVSSTVSFISDFIPVKNGDTVYFTGIDGNDIYKGTSAVNFMRIVKYDTSKTTLDYSDYDNGVSITANGFIRVAIANAALSYKLLSITLNSYPANASEMQTYFTPYYECVDTTARADIGDISADVSDMETALTLIENALAFVEPNNKFDSNAKTLNAGLNISGQVVASTTGFVSDYIPVKNGDTVYLTAVNGSDEYKGINATNFFRICLYDTSKSILSHSDYANSVSVSADGFIRCEFVNSYLNMNIVSITLNTYPTNKSSVETYFTPHYIIPIPNSYCDEHVVDCWGDSRIENGSAGTPMPTYLGQKLGAGYTVNNYGESSQTSGEVAMRYGTNEVYITLDGNEIPATTDPVDVTTIICSTGDRFGYGNLYNLSGAKPVECYLCGVKGYLSITNISTKKFTRAEEGSVVSVPPCSRAWVVENDSDSHVVLIWVGKNDQVSAGDAWYKKGILSNIKGMVGRLNHDHFIILGDTNDTDDSQKQGTNWYNRIVGLNAELAKIYPSNFIDVRTKLIEDGLTDAGLTPTADDTAWIAVGCIPPSLMADMTHPNDYGKELVARYVYQFMQNKGWA